MKRLLLIALGAGMACIAVPFSRAHAESALSPAEARALAVDVYVYFYPLVSMDVTRRVFTNVEPGKEFAKGPANTFVNVPEYPSADFKGIVRINFDTLYSNAWLDLTREPLVISVPDTQGRYYLLPLLDMWTDVFASPGWRTTGTGAGHFLVTPPGWKGTVPAGFTHIPAPTPHVWIFGRTQANGPQEYAAAHQVQSGYKITPLSQWGQSPTPVTAMIDPTVDMITPPKVQVDSMPAEAYFACAVELLKLHPPHSTDQIMIARMKSLGIEPGRSFDLRQVDATVRAAIEGAPQAAQSLMKTWNPVPLTRLVAPVETILIKRAHPGAELLLNLSKSASLPHIVNGWMMNYDTMGRYGNHYLKRAIIAQQGLGANLPEDSVYLQNLADHTAQPLHGEHRYTIHFTKDTIPPVDAFWSITLYGEEGFQVGNPLNRFAVSSWMPFHWNADGSLDLYFQNDSPGQDREANWLPAPKGDFNLTMRLYAPKPDVLKGQWNPPPIKRLPSDKRRGR